MHVEPAANPRRYGLHPFHWRRSMAYTAADLLRDLQALTPEQLALPAYSDGCDCEGPAAGIVVNEADILVARNESIGNGGQ